MGRQLSSCRPFFVYSPFWRGNGLVLDLCFSVSLLGKGVEMVQMSFLDQVIENTGRGASVVSEQHDGNQINWAAGLSDPGEMIRCGYMPEARRLEGESDEDYQKRLLSMDMPAILGAERFGKLLKAAQMRASLAKTKDGRVSMFSAIVPPWHGLGTLIDQAATSKEALQFAGLADWDLKKVEQYIDFNDKRLKTGMYAVVRGDKGVVLGSVGKRYKILSNEASFDFLDSVVDGQETRYETAGAIGEGEKVWMLAKMPSASFDVVGGDTIESYIMFTTSHDGSQAVTCFPCGERVVCANTYRNAMNRRRGAGITIRHTTNLDHKVHAAKRALGLAKDSCEEFAQTARTLAGKPMPNPEALFTMVLDDIVDVTIAETKVTGANINGREVLDAIMSIKDVEERQKSEERLEKARERRASLLDQIVDTYHNERCNGMPGLQGTAWAAVNAVSEAVQHDGMFRYRGTERERRESHFESVMTGRAQELTQLAVELAMKA